MFIGRIPSAKKNEKMENVDLPQPVYVGDFPQAVHDEQTSFLRNSVPG